MIAYIDSSVFLRIVLQQPELLREWGDIHLGVSSQLLRVECDRALDRLWHMELVDEHELALKRAECRMILGRLELKPLNDTVLEIASRPLPTMLATLDALHLATALAYRTSQPGDERPIVVATHDRALAEAARAMHFDVIGA